MNLVEQVYQTIVTTGWTQKAYETRGKHNEVKSVCLIGGIGLTLYNDAFAMSQTSRSMDPSRDVTDGRRVMNLLSDIIQEQFSDRSISQVSHVEAIQFDPLSVIIRFNDHPDTTLEDIECVCNKAARRLEEEV